ncbi:MAG: hypothetical protein N2Z69_01715, partial [Methylophilaceae bacterium]|nr:hypothetical protein [Methylophilaceae bacterium]
MKNASLAALGSLLVVLPAQAQEIVAVEDVVVTATRQEARVSEVLTDVTVIDRQEIERHGA